MGVPWPLTLCNVKIISESLEQWSVEALGKAWQWGRRL